MKKTRANDDVHVALLRGINVGGNNKLPMKELVAIFEAIGARDVRTYIQSGNVVFRLAEARAARAGEQVAAAIAERHALRTPVVMRTAEELRAAARGNPFLRAGVDEGELHLVFLADRPRAAAVAKLDPSRSPGDELVVRDRDVYLRLPNGVARSKLTNAWFDATLATTSTMRNWRTVQKLVEMISEA